jgi:hypothetical protein
MDFSDDAKFFTYSFEDETSQFDPKGRWVPGAEFYERTMYCRVPLELKDDEDLIGEFIDQHWDEEGFWRDEPEKG